MVVLGRGGFPTPKSSPLVSPVANISNIGSLKRFPDRDAARDMLHDVARMTASLINEFGFKVGTLCEMYPKSPNLLGLNVNHGQKIMLRLRFHSNDRLFLPLEDVIETFLHELAHNVHGPHNAAFYKLLDKLRDRYLLLRSGTIPKNGYRCEMNRLGGAHNASGMRDERLKRFGLRKEARKLGGVSGKLSGNELRRSRLIAIQRRLQDNKWCQEPETINSEKSESSTSIIVIEDEDEQSCAAEVKGVDTTHPSKVASYRELIDLTLDDIDDDPVEVQSCLACEKSGKKRVAFRVRPILGTPANFSQSGKSLNSNLYKTVPFVYTFTSTPGKTYFGEQDKYPRRKIVALLKVEDIIEWNEKEKNISTSLSRLSSGKSFRLQKQSQLKLRPKLRRERKVVKMMSMEELLELTF